jgi:peptidyl-tRNA hydrolase
VGPRPEGFDELSDYVLDAFQIEEREILDDLLDPMADAVETWIDQGIEIAMTRHNRS